MKPVNESAGSVKVTGLNVRYLHEAVTSMDNIAVNLVEGGVLKPFYLTDRQPDYRFYHLVMPLRVDNIKSRKQTTEQNVTKAA
jgi:DNA polymerase III sliding clamp (beta) subunit (PCNA family)